jgi:transcription elongation factor Elf1
MAIWIVTCPVCGTENEIPADSALIECGKSYGECTCSNCGCTFTAIEDYLLWLGMARPLPEEFQGRD